MAIIKSRNSLISHMCRSPLDFYISDCKVNVMLQSFDPPFNLAIGIEVKKDILDQLCTLVRNIYKMVDLDDTADNNVSYMFNMAMTCIWLEINDNCTFTNQFTRLQSKTTHFYNTIYDNTNTNLFITPKIQPYLSNNIISFLCYGDIEFYEK